MEYDQEMQSLNMTEDEKLVVEHIFVEDHKKTMKLNAKFFDEHKISPPTYTMIRHNDRIWFDPESGTGICPEILVRFLRNEQPQSNFDFHQMFECKYHLEFLPSDLFYVAMKVYRQHRRTEPQQWEQDGF